MAADAAAASPRYDKRAAAKTPGLVSSERVVAFKTRFGSLQPRVRRGSYCTGKKSRVSRVNVNTTEATTGATALCPGSPRCLFTGGSISESTPALTPSHSVSKDGIALVLRPEGGLRPYELQWGASGVRIQYLSYTEKPLHLSTPFTPPQVKSPSDTGLSGVRFSRLGACGVTFSQPIETVAWT